jgi:hypothetical protein
MNLVFQDAHRPSDLLKAVRGYSIKVHCENAGVRAKSPTRMRKLIFVGFLGTNV